ncbi:hypothetical protein J9874_00978 [Duffyella gerundensis]|uniref:Putative membrane protein n=1 Tax=Duffyella gerundensis TaxID=1619313 RepID=A0A0U5L6B6_9GAMM|nr:hypothetical protein J9874_00978 [Duffyella gerundensis]CUU24704.1 putative membrane protein [Duffyella gerundensis]
MIYYALLLLSLAAMFYATWRMKKQTSKKSLTAYRARR